MDMELGEGRGMNQVRVVMLFCSCSPSLLPSFPPDCIIPSRHMHHGPTRFRWVQCLGLGGVWPVKGRKGQASFRGRRPPMSAVAGSRQRPLLLRRPHRGPASFPLSLLPLILTPEFRVTQVSASALRPTFHVYHVQQPSMCWRDSKKTQRIHGFPFFHPDSTNSTTRHWLSSTGVH